MKTIAFIGLGVMGQLMAANLVAAGFAVQSFDLNRKGNRKSARDAAAGADALITMLPDGDTVRDAVIDALPGLKPGAVVIDMSSSDPAGTRALGLALEKNSVQMVDAPVSGASFKAKDGTLAIMVGGEKETVAKVMPVLQKLGTEIFHVGPLGRRARGEGTEQLPGRGRNAGGIRGATDRAALRPRPEADAGSHQRVDRTE